MNMKLVGLLVAVIVILLGLLGMMMRAKPEVVEPVAVTAPAPIQPKPNPRGGSYKKTPPGKYEYTTPK